MTHYFGKRTDKSECYLQRKTEDRLVDSAFHSVRN